MSEAASRGRRRARSAARVDQRVKAGPPRRAPVRASGLDCAGRWGEGRAGKRKRSWESGLLGQEFGRGQVAERLMGPNGVVDILPRPQFRPQLSQRPGAGSDLIQLLLMGPVRPLDVRLRRIELGRVGRQHKEAQASLLSPP